jgi:Fe2+ or Zn2+ uptake regulation protein
MVLESVHEHAGELLASAGQRYTPERRLIVEALASADRPLTVVALREVRPDVPLSSAYRNLAVLERVGVVERVRTADDHARFELSEALTDRHHHHLVCTGCGAVEDFTVAESLERSLAQRLAEVAADRGFRSAGHRLDLVGVCAACG